MHLRRLHDPLDHFGRLEGLAPEVEPPRVELVREQDLVDDPTEALRLVGDQRDEAVPAAFVEREVVAQERLRGSVHRGQRRAQLVGGRCDEVGLELLEVMHLGQVVQQGPGDATPFVDA